MEYFALEPQRFNRLTLALQQHERGFRPIDSRGDITRVPLVMLCQFNMGFYATVTRRRHLLPNTNSLCSSVALPVKLREAA